MSSSSEAATAAAAVKVRQFEIDNRSMIPTSFEREYENCKPLPADTLIYKPKVILLTGGAGFIGSSVSNHLVTAYPHYKIHILDKLDRCSSLNNLIKHPNIIFHKGDICDSSLVYHLIREHEVDTIMHFAAQSHVDNSFGDSLAFTESNVLGTHVLLEAAKAFNQQVLRFIYVSTDEVYGEQNMLDQRVKEDAPQNPTNPYAASKAAAETMIQSYILSFQLPAIITRSNNVYGPRQFPEKLIPKFIWRLRDGLPATIHGTGQNRRSYVYVTDIARAFDIVLHRAPIHSVYNLGSEDELQNIQIFNKLFDIVKARGYCKEDKEYVTFVRDRAFNDFRYYITTDSLKHLGWVREVGIDKGLQLTVNWYLDHCKSNHWGKEALQVALDAHPHFPPQVRATGPMPDEWANQQLLAPPLTTVDGTQPADPKSETPHRGSLSSTTSSSTASSSSLRWLVYGHRGWLGAQFVGYLRKLRPSDVVVTSDARVDVEQAVAHDIETHRPNRVVCMIGRLIGPGFNNVDYLEQKGKLGENVRDNLYAPVELAVICSRYHVHYTYLGTGCIFTHDDAHPVAHVAKVKKGDAEVEEMVPTVGFTESDNANFSGSSYSVVKGYADRLMHLFASTSLNVRIRLPVNAVDEKRNLLSKLIRYSKIANAPNSLTVVNEMFPILIDMVVLKETGTVNLTNPGSIDHNEILNLYKEVVEPSHTWTIVTPEEQKASLAAERCNCTLATDRLQAFQPRVRTVQQAIRDIMVQFKENRERSISDNVQPFLHPLAHASASSSSSK